MQKNSTMVRIPRNEKNQNTLVRMNNLMMVLSVAGAQAEDGVAVRHPVEYTCAGGAKPVVVSSHHDYTMEAILQPLRTACSEPDATCGTWVEFVNNDPEHDVCYAGALNLDHVSCLRVLEEEIMGEKVVTGVEALFACGHVAVLPKTAMEAISECRLPDTEDDEAEDESPGTIQMSSEFPKLIGTSKGLVEVRDDLADLQRIQVTLDTAWRADLKFPNEVYIKSGALSEQIGTMQHEVYRLGQSHVEVLHTILSEAPHLVPEELFDNCASVVLPGMMDLYRFYHNGEPVKAVLSHADHLPMYFNESGSLDEWPYPNVVQAQREGQCSWRSDGERRVVCTRWPNRPRS